MRLLVLAFLLAPLSVVAVEPEAEPACDLGPVQRDFGTTTWNVYACSDGKSVAVYPLEDITGDAGYFFVTPNGKGVLVSGEAWGEDASFHPVFQQLKQFTAAQLAALAKSAKAAKPAASATP